jgi:hypothetical protein
MLTESMLRLTGSTSMLPLVDLDPDAGESIQPGGMSMMADCGLLLLVSVDNRLAGIEGSTWTCGRAVPGVGGVVSGIQNSRYVLCASVAHRCWRVCRDWRKVPLCSRDRSRVDEQSKSAKPCRAVCHRRVVSTFQVSARICVLGMMPWRRSGLEEVDVMRQVDSVYAIITGV